MPYKSKQGIITKELYDSYQATSALDKEMTHNHFSAA